MITNVTLLYCPYTLKYIQKHFTKQIWAHFLSPSLELKLEASSIREAVTFVTASLIDEASSSKQGDGIGPWNALLVTPIRHTLDNYTCDAAVMSIATQWYTTKLFQLKLAYLAQKEGTCGNIEMHQFGCYTQK